MDALDTMDREDTEQPYAGLEGWKQFWSNFGHAKYRVHFY